MEARLNVPALSPVITRRRLIRSRLRTHQTDYDSLGSVVTQSVAKDESGGSVPRPFTFNHQYAQGRSTRVGPDGVETVTELDAAGRVSLVRRGPEASPVMTASYTYHANGLAASVTHGNGTAVHYQYDAAGRVTEIRHVGASLGEFKLVYEYDVRGLPVRVDEFAPGGQSAFLYAYDHRGRLYREIRTGDGAYDYLYAYDQGGNRLRKVDALNDRWVEYTYDVSAGVDYGTFNNRLMEAREYDASGPPSEPEPLLSQVWYYYNCGGNVTRVVRNEAGSNVYTATRMEYAKNGRTVTYVLGESWEWSGNPSGCPIEYAVSYAREFRYDGARQRYLNRPLDPATLAPITDFGAAVWTDYDGDAPYGDYVVSGLNSAVDWRSYEPGIGEVGPWSGSGDANTQYHHADHLGTLRLRTFPNGVADATRVFSAFGERLGGPAEADRYGYVGAHGYQAHGEFPFLHVGARYYDPASGRFLQRDPIGIIGGRNAYAYARNQPTDNIDPSGHWPPGSVPPAAFYKGANPGYSPIEHADDIRDQVYDEGDSQGKSDSWMHFVVSCRITSEVPGGFLLLLPLSLFKEIIDNVGPNPGGFLDSVEDMLNNMAGWASGPGAAVFGSSCYDVADDIGIR